MNIYGILLGDVTVTVLLPSAIGNAISSPEISWEPFLPDTEDNVVAFRLKGQPAGDTWKDITVILNARDRSTPVQLPEGTWQVVCRDGRISPVKGLGTMPGGQVIVAPRSALIVHQ